jgi:carboxyl-terminal processing protease
MAELKRLTEAGMKKLIIDLRQNPGGYLTAATMIADELIKDDKLIVYTEGNSSRRKDYNSSHPGLFEKGDVDVMIDEGSASASEILAGAIQDWDRGIITGRRSFGKGLVQEQFALRDGSALRLTIARYYTPSGRSIQRTYDNGSANYYNEIAERFNTGELTDSTDVPIADSVKYYTAKGRVVYGGGGIMPDYFIPLDSLTELQNLAKIRSYIPEFVYDMLSKNPQQFNQYQGVKDFSSRYVAIPDALYNNFINSARTKGLDLSDEVLSALKPKTEVMLRAQMARQLWKNEGFYAIFNTIDNTFLKTLELLKKPQGFTENAK